MGQAGQAGAGRDAAEHVFAGITVEGDLYDALNAIALEGETEGETVEAVLRGALLTAEKPDGSRLTRREWFAVRRAAKECACDRDEWLAGVAVRSLGITEEEWNAKPVEVG